MNDRPFIVAGLIVFVAIVTTPLWRGVTARNVVLAAPEIKLPAHEKQCVAPLNYMRASHMQLLEQWRDDVVRQQQPRYAAYNGRVYEKSLSKTCLSQCHGSRQEFCDRCHNYNGVAALNCWECHNDAPPAPRSTP